MLVTAKFSFEQYVGIGTPTPNEKLHVDSGNIKIGKEQWSSSANSKYLKFGDGNYVTIGEEEADDKLTIRAKELLIRPSEIYTTVPISIQGSTNYSHFFFGANEDTYIRAGKNNGNVILNDITGGKVGIGAFPTRAILEQNGSVGSTAAIFGGDGAGISLQKNWPVIGFNHYFDGANHKSIGQGYSGVFGVNQINGNLYYGSWAFAGAPNANLASYTSRFVVTRDGKIGLGTDVPNTDLHIIQKTSNDPSDESADMGITMEGNAIYAGSHAQWNIHVGRYYTNPFSSYDGLSFWKQLNNTGWYNVAGIGTNGQYYQFSDLNLKKDIRYIDNDCLVKIMQLKPATYHFINDSAQSPLDYGFIAQDVEIILPGFVATYSKNKMIAYSKFIPILTKGMQEQQQQIESLQKENTDLKARMERLEKLLLKQ